MYVEFACQREQPEKHQTHLRRAFIVEAIYQILFWYSLRSGRSPFHLEEILPLDRIIIDCWIHQLFAKPNSRQRHFVTLEAADRSSVNESVVEMSALID
jgi:hypothetical protein